MAALAKRHFPALDGIRGLAALAVLFLHVFYGSMYSYLHEIPLNNWHGKADLVASLSRYGWAGVDLFFVLSGFLITRILRATIHQPGAVRDFFVKRASRIFPLYYLVLAIIALTGLSLPFLILSSMFLMNLMPLFPPGREYAIVWSLSIEMQFYLFWPFVVRASTRRQLGLVAAAILLLCPVVRELMIWYAPNYQFSWVRIDGMAWGVLLALGLEAKGDSTFLPISVIAMAVGTAVFLSAILGKAGLTVSHQFSIEMVGAQIFSCGLVAFGISNPGNKSILANLWLRKLGEISYGVYLIHPAMMMLWDHFDPIVHGSVSFLTISARAGFVAAATLTLATVSFYRFEKPAASWINSKFKLRDSTNAEQGVIALGPKDRFPR